MKRFSLALILLMSINTQMTFSVNPKLKYGSGIVGGLITSAIGSFTNVYHLSYFAHIAGQAKSLRCFDKMLKDNSSMSMSLLDHEICAANKKLNDFDNKKFILPTLLMILGAGLTKYSYDRYPSN